MGETETLVYGSFVMSYATAKVPVSKAVFNEVEEVLRKAGYGDRIGPSSINMNELSLVLKVSPIQEAAEKGFNDRG